MELQLFQNYRIDELADYKTLKRPKEVEEKQEERAEEVPKKKEESVEKVSIRKEDSWKNTSPKFGKEKREERIGKEKKTLEERLVKEAEEKRIEEERLAREKQELIQKEEEMKERQKAEAERLARERQEKEAEEERLNKEAEEKRLKEEQERKAREEAEEKAQEEQKKERQQAEAERLARERQEKEAEEDRLNRDAEEKKLKEEQERKAKEEAERKDEIERERSAKAEERKKERQQAETERLPREEEKRKGQEEIQKEKEIVEIEEEKHSSWSSTTKIETDLFGIVKELLDYSKEKVYTSNVSNDKKCKPENIKEARKQVEENLPENAKTILQQKLDAIEDEYNCIDKAIRHRMKTSLDKNIAIAEVTNIGITGTKKLEEIASEMLKFNDPTFWRGKLMPEAKKKFFSDCVRIYLEEHLLVFKSYTTTKDFLKKYTVNGETIENNFALKLNDDQEETTKLKDAVKQRIAQVGIGVYSMIKRAKKKFKNRLITELAKEVLNFKNDFLSSLDIKSFSSIAIFCKKFTKIIVKQYNNIFEKFPASDIRKFAQIVVERQIPLFFDTEYKDEKSFLRDITSPIVPQEKTFDIILDKVSLEIVDENNKSREEKVSNIFRNLGFVNGFKRARPKNSEVFEYLIIRKHHFKKLETQRANEFEFVGIPTTGPKSNTCIGSHKTCTTTSSQSLTSNQLPITPEEERRQKEKERNLKEEAKRKSIEEKKRKESVERNSKEESEKQTRTSAEAKQKEEQLRKQIQAKEINRKQEPFQKNIAEAKKTEEGRKKEEHLSQHSRIQSNQFTCRSGDNVTSLRKRFENS